MKHVYIDKPFYVNRSLVFVTGEEYNGESVLFIIRIRGLEDVDEYIFTTLLQRNSYECVITTKHLNLDNNLFLVDFDLN